MYDKVLASIKDSFKDFIPMDSEKEREMLKERDAKRLLRKRKATIAEEQPSKKPKAFIIYGDIAMASDRTGLIYQYIGETAASSDDDIWKDQEEWEIIRWRFHESSGSATLEIKMALMNSQMLAEEILLYQES
ncbi:hypothetical protein Tco_1037756 [Tanacetum coccineum]